MGFEEMPKPESEEGFDFAKDMESLKNNMAVLMEDGELPRQAQDAFAELQVAKDDWYRLVALNILRDLLRFFEPVKHESVAQDTKALVNRLVYELERQDKKM